MYLIIRSLNQLITSSMMFLSPEMGMLTLAVFN